jgi:hypothetical protein
MSTARLVEARMWTGLPRVGILPPPWRGRRPGHARCTTEVKSLKYMYEQTCPHQRQSLSTSETKLVHRHIYEIEAEIVCMLIHMIETDIVCMLIHMTETDIVCMHICMLDRERLQTIQSHMGSSQRK